MKEHSSKTSVTTADVTVDNQRRIMLKIAGLSAAGGCAMHLGEADAQEGSVKGMSKGDLLVPAKGEQKPVRLEDIKVGAKPLLVFPFDEKNQKPRDESRLNKLMLVRMDEAELSDELKARAVSGVLAFSAVCTHQGCDVTEYVVADKLLMCFCHFSKFSPADGTVAKGPASKSLPWVALAQKEGFVVVAGEFSARPGV
jgi:rieske iron-sulfur protein